MMQLIVKRASVEAGFVSITFEVLRRMVGIDRSMYAQTQQMTECPTYQFSTSENIGPVAEEWK